MATKTRKQLKREAQGTPLTPRTEEEENTFLETIRKIVKDELENYQAEIKDIIKENIKNTNARLDKISEDVTDLKQSLEFTQDKIKEEMIKVKSDIKNLERNVKVIEDDLLDPDYVSSKLIELEDRSRRNNLRVDGIMQEPNETWEECEKRIQDLIKEELEITDVIEFERCHRMSFQKNTTKNQNRPRTIICKLNKFKDKQKILKNAKCLKNTGIYIYEDFCKDTMDLRKELWNKVLEYRSQNKFACLNYRNIIVRDHGRDRVVR